MAAQFLAVSSLEVLPMHRRSQSFVMTILLVLTLAACAPSIHAQEAQASPAASSVQTVEINKPTVEAEVGKKVVFTAVAKDATGKVLDQKPSAWFAAPFDLALADDTGTVSFFQPGEVLVGALIGGKAGYIKVMVKPTPVARIDVEKLSRPVVVGGTAGLRATARTANGNPRNDALISWASDNPAVAAVD